jgi:iron complex transport system substrate-binding protein
MMRNILKRHYLLALILVTVLIFSGCAKGDSPSAESTEGIEITDMTGQKIVLEEPADRIVGLTASDCEILYALNAGDTLVGRGEYCDFPEQILDVKAVKSGSDTNVEQIIALQPQLVIMGNMDQTQQQIDAIKNAGIQVLITDPQKIEDIYVAIEIIGKAVGKNDEAKGLIAEMQSTFDQITPIDSAEGKKTVYFEVSPLEYGLWAAGTNTFMDEIAKMAGLENAFSDFSGWGQVSQEQVFERDPDYIVAVPMSYGSELGHKQEIMNRKGWQNLKAVKNDAVYIADADEITRPGPRIANAAKDFYSFVCGGLSEK